MLTTGMTKYVRRKYIEKLANCGYDKASQRIYDKRLQRNIGKAFKELTLLADNLPEEQLEEHFNAKTLAPFFEALFKLEISAADHKDWVEKKESTEIRAKRDRLLKIAGAALMTIGNDMFVRKVLPELLSRYVESFPYKRNFEFIITQAIH